MTVSPSSASQPPHALYVYYRVPIGREAVVQQRVMALFMALTAAQPGLQTRLMCKVSAAPDGDQAATDATWMEVYEHPLGVSVMCLKHMQDMAQTLLADQTGPRHLELFAPVPPADVGLA